MVGGSAPRPRARRAAPRGTGRHGRGRVGCCRDGWSGGLGTRLGGTSRYGRRGSGVARDVSRRNRLPRKGECLGETLHQRGGHPGRFGAGQIQLVGEGLGLLIVQRYPSGDGEGAPELRPAGVQRLDQAAPRVLVHTLGRHHQDRHVGEVVGEQGVRPPAYQRFVPGFGVGEAPSQAVVLGPGLADLALGVGDALVELINRVLVEVGAPEQHPDGQGEEDSRQAHDVVAEVDHGSARLLSGTKGSGPEGPVGRDR